MKSTIQTPRGLAVDSRGTGEPLLVIHGPLVADGCAPLALELKKDPRLDVIEYRRRGYDPVPVGAYGLEIEEGARDAAEVLEHAALEPAHVLGFSLGAHIALQLALDVPGRVRSLVLIEPAFPLVPAATSAFGAVREVVSLYQIGDRQTAVSSFLAVLAGEDYRARLDVCLPAGWADKAVDEAATYFTGELPASALWDFNRQAAARITIPVLLVHGDGSLPVFVETQALLQSWLPNARTVAIPGAGHFSPALAPVPVAAAILEFIAAAAPRPGPESAASAG